MDVERMLVEGEETLFRYGNLHLTTSKCIWTGRNPAVIFNDEISSVDSSHTTYPILYTLFKIMIIPTIISWVLYVLVFITVHLNFYLSGNALYKFYLSNNPTYTALLSTLTAYASWLWALSIILLVLTIILLVLYVVLRPRRVFIRSPTASIVVPQMEDEQFSEFLSKLTSHRHPSHFSGSPVSESRRPYL